MRLRLDNHIFLWYITGNVRLPATLLSIMRDPNSELYLSVVSVWEIAVKYQLGKLPLPQSPGIYIPQQRLRHQIDSLTLNEASVGHLSTLPALHRDPFDRMLLCQAIQHRLTLASVDQVVRTYSPTISIIP